MTDSEYNLDPNCLSRCSTELFSEASWEQVDKQDTEVSGRAGRRRQRRVLFALLQMASDVTADSR